MALLLALAFEFVNGFHDTANAVATVIYTKSLRASVAVIWSGIWNLIGVLSSSGAVAFGVVALLPVELVLNVGTGAGFIVHETTGHKLDPTWVSAIGFLVLGSIALIFTLLRGQSELRDPSGPDDEGT